MKSYDDCLRTMYAFRRFGIILGLSTIEQTLDELGRPQETFSIIHVAGTNGKGSIASTLSVILNLAGYKVGLYTSPHLVKFNERICIDNHPISDEEVVNAYEAVNKVHHGSREPTFFEFATAMAFYEFAGQNVDWAVIETGMGGRLDATNVVKPEISVISNISLEHQSYLGKTLPEIAREKGGIIKKETPVVTGAKQKHVTAVLKDIAGELSAPFYRYRTDFRTRKKNDGKFDYFGVRNIWRDMRTGLPGGHQVENAAISIAACEVLNNGNAGITEEHIRTGLSRNRWPGRLEILPGSPTVILDGAHNLSAARKLSEFLSGDLKNKPVTLVIGILDDKPCEAILKTLFPVCDRVVLTKPDTYRALSPDTLQKIAKQYLQHVEIIPEVGKAVKHALETSPENSVVCVAGSLYVVGEAKTALKNDSFRIMR